jgi:RNA polymerase sigma-70 factor (ECF subfamily)
MPQEPASPTPDADWRDALAHDDEDAFRAAVKPYMDDLIAAAGNDLGYYESQDYLNQEDFTPEEVVGETLIHAWSHRERRPEDMDLRNWLLGVQYRVLRRLVARQRAYREDKVVSLDETLPTQPETYAEGEWFAEWHDPETGGVTYDEIIPSAQPVDLELDLREETQRANLDPDSYHVLMLHDEFEMALPQVAATMNRSVREMADLLDAARATFQDRHAETPITEADHPAPPDDA